MVVCVLTSCVSHFICGKEPLYPLSRRLGGPQSRSFWRREKSPTPNTILTPEWPSCSVDACWLFTTLAAIYSVILSKSKKTLFHNILVIYVVTYIFIHVFIHMYIIIFMSVDICSGTSNYLRHVAKGKEYFVRYVANKAYIIYDS
jgi:hypothetical protein